MSEVNIEMSGDFCTRVFEGPYKEAPKWYQKMQEKLEVTDKKTGEIYFFYATCPKGAKVCGKNYVAGFGKAA